MHWSGPYAGKMCDLRRCLHRYDDPRVRWLRAYAKDDETIICHFYHWSFRLPCHFPHLVISTALPFPPDLLMPTNLSFLPPCHFRPRLIFSTTLPFAPTCQFHHLLISTTLSFPPPSHFHHLVNNFHHPLRGSSMICKGTNSEVKATQQ
jgi:hypothetical protein